VIKAEIQVQQAQNAVTEAQLAQQQAKLGLAVLLFPSFNQNFTLVDDLDQAPPLPPLARIQALASAHNPALAQAQAALAQAGDAVNVARAGLLPSLALDYGYGIDASQFARRDAAGQSNLSYLAAVTVSVPVFNWGANRAKVHQFTLLRQLAQKQLSLAQRQLLANLQGEYAQAEAARGELTTLARTRADATESLRLVGLRYRSGAATILELVDAQNTLTLARDAYDTGQVRYRVARAQLQTLTGAF
jgi:outer membrane protein TolC